MKGRSPTALVDELGRLAGRAEPPSLTDDASARRIVDRAMRLAAAPQPVPAARRPRRWTLAFTVAAAAAVWWLAPRTTVAPAEPAVMHVTLPTGDRLVGVAGAQFDVERLAATDRRLRLRSGMVLFDVAHVAAGQRFAVTTAHLVATATGTVFSVETDAESSQVRVYEGIVDVAQDGDVHLLAAGAIWSSRTHTTAIALQRPAALAPSVELAVRERATATPTATATAPTTTPAAPTIASSIATSDPPAPVTGASTSSAATAAPAPAAPRESLARLFTTARDQLAAGKLEDALATARLAAARAPWTGAWWQLVGDASRGLGRSADAADAFDRAARDLTGAEQREAGYAAAYIRFHELLDGERALSSLDASLADADGSPLEERASGLRVQILAALGRRDAARAGAVHYLAQFPHADLRAYMLSLTQP